MTAAIAQPRRSTMAKRRKTRAGRPRRQTSRQPNGQPQRERLGPTPEWVRHRQAVIGATADPTLGRSWLAALCALGKISRRSLAAGEVVAWAYCERYGKPWPKALDYDERRAGEPDEDTEARRLEKADKLLRDAERVFREAGADFDVLRRVACLDEPLRQDDDLSHLRAGLTELGRYWYGHDEDADRPDPVDRAAS